MHYFKGLSAFALVSALSLTPCFAQVRDSSDEILLGRCNPDDPLCGGDDLGFESTQEVCELQVPGRLDFAREFGPIADAAIHRAPNRRQIRLAPNLAPLAQLDPIPRESRLLALFEHGSVAMENQRRGSWRKVMTISRLDEGANHVDFAGLPFQGGRLPRLAGCVEQRTLGGGSETVRHICRLVPGSSTEAVCKVLLNGQLVGVEAFLKE